MKQALDRIREAYAGETGARWARIERGRPAGYLERNVALGRARLHELLLEWLGDVGGLRVLDAGCGSGALVAELARRGATATGVDLAGAFVGQRIPGATLVHGDFLERLTEAAYDAVLLIHVLEDYPAEERWELIRRVAESATPRIFLGFAAVAPDGDGLWTLLGGADRIDAVELLRRIHTGTLYSQTRQQVIKIRNYRAVLSELDREQRS